MAPDNIESENREAEEETPVNIAGVVVVAIVVATACCAWVATITEFKPELCLQL